MFTRSTTAIQVPPEQTLDPTDYPQTDSDKGSQPESVPTTAPDPKPNSEPTLPPELDPESPSKPV